MKLTIGFIWLYLVITAAASSQSSSSVICYVDSSTQRLFHHINASLCTHITSASAYIGDDSSFRTVSRDPDSGCTSLKTLKERNPSLKTLIGVEIKQSRLEPLTQTQASLDKFIDSALSYLKQKNYDGLELIWVENTVADETPKSTEALTRFLKELKAQIKEDADLVNKSVSVSLPERVDSASNDEEALSQYVDSITVLPSSLSDEEPQIDSAVKYWQGQGVDIQKLIVALPAFLRRSRRREHGRHSETDKPNPEKVEQPYGPGLMIAKQVCSAIKSGRTELKVVSKLESTQSLGEELSWLLQKGLGGIGVVVLDVGSFTDSMCLDLTESQKAVLESKMISGSPHHLHSNGHGPHSRHGHHRHHHHHHHGDRDGGRSQEDPSFDSNDTGHRHGSHRHGHRHHGHGSPGHGHRGRSRHGHGPHGRHGDQTHEGHSHHDHHSSA